MAVKTTRYMDAQGRIIIPTHIRKALNLTAGKCVEVDMDDTGTIRITPTEERCVICGEPVSNKAHITASGKNICASCARAISYTIQEGK